MHTLAKRVHNIAPRPMLVTVSDTELRLTVRSAEFFQESFQAEAESPDGDVYRFVSDGTTDPLVGAKRTDDGWQPVGEVTAVERIDA